MSGLTGQSQNCCWASQGSQRDDFSLTPWKTSASIPYSMSVSGSFTSSFHNAMGEIKFSASRFPGLEQGVERGACWAWTLSARRPVSGLSVFQGLFCAASHALGLLPEPGFAQLWFCLVVQALPLSSCNPKPYFCLAHMRSTLDSHYKLYSFECYAVLLMLPELLQHFHWRLPYCLMLVMQSGALTEITPCDYRALCQAAQATLGL